MTNKRAKEIMLIRMACLKRASGLEYSLSEQKWIQTGDRCDMNCANCELGGTDIEELLDMYNNMIVQMTEKEYFMEERAKAEGWKDWQVEVCKNPPQELKI